MPIDLSKLVDPTTTAVVTCDYAEAVVKHSLAMLANVTTTTAVRATWGL